MNLQEKEVEKQTKEQAYMSAHSLTVEQTRKLIQAKFERAKMMSEAIRKSPNTNEEFQTVSVYGERDPAGHSKHPAINEGGDGDDKSVAKTQMCKNRPQ